MGAGREVRFLQTPKGERDFAKGSRARFRVQAFVERDVGVLLELLGFALRGARVRRWEGAFVFAEVEVDAKRAPWVRQGLRALARGRGVHVAAWLLEEEEPIAVRLGGMGEAGAGLSALQSVKVSRTSTPRFRLSRARIRSDTTR